LSSAMAAILVGRRANNPVSQGRCAGSFERMTTLLVLVLAIAVIVLAVRLRQRRQRRRAKIVKFVAFIVIAIAFLYIMKYSPLVSP